MEKHPFFMTKVPENIDDLPPAVEGNLNLFTNTLVIKNI